MDSRRNKLRPGFTAVEILIVVAIIALLVSITAGALVRVRAAAERTATETTLTKLASILDRHWKSVMESAKKEYDGLPGNIKQNLIALADNPNPPPAGLPYPHPRRDDRARLLYVKFRLKQEFPASFEQAVDPDPTFGNYLPPTGAPPAIPNRPTTVSGGQPARTTGKPAYVKFVTDFYSRVNMPTNQGISWSNKNIFPNPRYQSAMLLVAALEQDRPGATRANLEQEVGATFVLNGYNDEVSNKTVPVKNIALPRYLVDAWGGPLQLYIFPSFAFGTNASTTDLDVAYSFVPKDKTLTPPNALRQALASGGGPDPADPEGLLLDASISQWQPSPTLAAYLPYPQFSPQLVSSGASGITYTMRKMIPTIASAGPDGLIGSLQPNPAPPRPDNGWSAINPQMRFTNESCFDNIYSFRLRQSGARGD